MKFEIGKYYEHTAGKRLFICGTAASYMYGLCLIAECAQAWKYGDFLAVGNDESAAVNFKEITMKQFHEKQREELKSAPEGATVGSIASEQRHV
jgi:hypothetical protein